ncbi:hypothetical protein NDN08_000510 [Rhodosorus marinus]|uniref:YdhG-like domain-containing protein n=1 Tax=Rhodosorus marinus TaxID=101924 RepID=A0AAV8UN45_9RHOD|nr:hypothetical protein NDN08_000510 [Rhodosorus marinus]
MSGNKTKPMYGEDVEMFIENVSDKVLREDCREIHKLMQNVSKEEAILWGSKEGQALWGSAIVGFGIYEYTYRSGRSGEWMRLGYSPRKNGLSVYLGCGLPPGVDEEVKALGKCKSGRSCISIRRLSDIDLNVLETILRKSWHANDQIIENMNKRPSKEQKNSKKQAGPVSLKVGKRAANKQDTTSKKKKRRT